jgi:hypothetical protein
MSTVVQTLEKEDLFRRWVELHNEVKQLLQNSRTLGKEFKQRQLFSDMLTEEARGGVENAQELQGAREAEDVAWERYHSNRDEMVAKANEMVAVRNAYENS